MKSKITLTNVCVTGCFILLHLLSLSCTGLRIDPHSQRSPFSRKWLLNLSASHLDSYPTAAIASDSSLCSEIGKSILQRNGSAVDAAISTLLCVGIIDMHSAGIGGGSFMLLYEKETGKSFALDCRERAPSKANKTMFASASSVVGGLSVAVPGEVAGYYEAWRRFGRLPWGDLFQPSIKLCNDGFPISKALARAMKKSEKKIRASPSLKELLIDANNNTLYEEGTIIRNPKLGRTLSSIAQDPHTFYNGTLSRSVDEEIASAGGIITRQDLSNYRVKERQVIKTILPESKLEVLGFPPPSSGVLLAFILSVLDGYNFNNNSSFSEESYALFHHRLVETFKFAYAKRGGLGDPDFEELDELKNLTSKQFVEEVRRRITDNRTHSLEYYDPVFEAQADHGTTHLSLVAPNGDVVSWTSSINRYFGSGVRGSTTGIIYNDSMDDFSKPGVSNAFMLPPSPKNYIEPGKTPMSSMSPTIIFNPNGSLALVVGAAGGSMIISSVAYVTARHLFFKENIKEAIDAPRFHHQLLPNFIFAEKGFPEEILNRLKSKGHKTLVLRYRSIVEGISVRSQLLLANSDFRKYGGTAGF